MNKIIFIFLINITCFLSGCGILHGVTHKNIAYNKGAVKAGLYSILDKIIKTSSKAAIKISEKI